MNWFSKIKFYHWLVFSFVFFLLTMVLLGWYANRQLESIHKPALELHSKWMPATLAATEMKSAFNSYRVALLLRIEANDPNEVEYTEGQLTKRFQAYRENEAAFAKLISTQVERNLFDKSKQAMDGYFIVAN